MHGVVKFVAVRFAVNCQFFCRCSVDMPPKNRTKKSPTMSETGATANTRSGPQETDANAAAPPTRKDIPTIVQEVAKQLRSDGSEAHTHLVPGMFCSLL